MITFVVLLLFVTFTSVYPCDDCHVVNAVVLTPNNTNERGANIHVLHSDVTTTNTQWSVVTTNQVGFQLHVSLDDTWGFIDDHYSELWIWLINDNKDRTLSHTQLLTAFSDNSQYFASIVNSNQQHQIFPNCNNWPRAGNVEALVNISHNNQSRIQKATFDNLHDWPIWKSQMTEDYNTSWPLYFRIQYWPQHDGQQMILDLFNGRWTSHLHCRYRALFAPNQGLDIYIASANNGDAFNISRIYLEYASNAPTSAPTTATPTVSVNPTVSPTNPPHILTSSSSNPTYTSSDSPTSANPNTSSSSISSTVTDIDDGSQYSVRYVFTFQYEPENDNSTNIIAETINDVIEDELSDDCVDGTYRIRVDRNISTVFVNASIFVCDQTAQNRLYVYVSENTLQADVITIMNDNLDIIVAPNDFTVLSVEKITRHSDIVESTEIADEAISTTEYAKTMKIYKQSDVLVLVALVGILCVAIVLILIDVLCICRLDRFHVIHILVLALTICNLLTDVVVSYRLYVHYVKVNDGVLVLILLVCTNLCIVIPYLYHIIFGTRTLYAIPSHLCCLFSNLLLIISGDLYATFNILYVFDVQAVSSISIEIQNKAKITIILCHVSQMIIQSIFVIHVLRYSDAFIIVSIVFSFATLIPYCVHKNTELAPLVTKHNTLKIDVLRSVVTDETYTSVNTPSRPRDDVSDVHHANEDEETDEDLYVGNSKHTSTPRARGTPGSETVYTAIKFDDLDVEHSSLPRLPDEHVSVSANVNGIMVTNKGAEKEIEGQQQTTGTRNEEDGDEVKENVLLDAILSEVLEKQELDPNKIHEMNANEMDHNSNKSISNDSDKIYDRYP